MTIVSRTFALEVDGKPTLVFEARNLREAQALCKEAWLHDDLAGVNSGGHPLYTIGSKLSVRSAIPDEAAVFNGASAAAKPTDEMVLVYLIDLDGP
jgi:hypothetical protein